jgi:hypothetical protein
MPSLLSLLSEERHHFSSGSHLPLNEWEWFVIFFLSLEALDSLHTTKNWKPRRMPPLLVCDAMKRRE